MSKSFLPDVGTALRLNTGVDLSSASTLQIKYKKPDGELGVWSATVYSTTYAQYILQSGDIDQNGLWTFQVYTVLPSWSGYGEVFKKPFYIPEVT
jgi:hypothetical protein